MLDQKKEAFDGEKKKINPFVDYGILNYEQYKRYPFLKIKSISQLEKKINNQINSDFQFRETLLILGNAGIGKTSALFFVHDLLKASKKCNVIILSDFFIDMEDFKSVSQGESLKELSKYPTYILIDFPDTINPSTMKKFLNFLWILMNSKYPLSFIFALNDSHLARSLNYSQVLGKFNTVRIEKMSFEESHKLIRSRLEMTGYSDFFEEKVYEIVYRYSKGIPRNIIKACMNIFDEFIEFYSVGEKEVSSLLESTFAGEIINDRVLNIEDRPAYKKVVEILKDRYEGKAENQEELIKVIRNEMEIGRNKVMKLIADLNKFGIITIAKGGENNTKKIILT